MAEAAPRSRTLKAPLLWVAGVLVVAGAVVQSTGVGIDLFALLLAGSLLFVLERTVGDGVAELIGPVGAAVLFCAIALLGFGYVLTESGQSRAKRLVILAQSRGYQPVYFFVDPRDNDKDNDKDKKRPPVGPPPPAGGEKKPASTDVALARGTAPGGRPAAADPKSSDSAKSEVVTPGLLSHFMSDDVPLARLIVTPNVVSSGEPVNLEVRFVGSQVALKGPVAFLVNGREIARVDPNSAGVISSKNTQIIPGTYEASARLPAGTRATAPGPVSFTVLPPRR